MVKKIVKGIGYMRRVLAGANNEHSIFETTVYGKRESKFGSNQTSIFETRVLGKAPDSRIKKIKKKIGKIFRK